MIRVHHSSWRTGMYERRRKATHIQPEQQCVTWGGWLKSSTCVLAGKKTMASSCETTWWRENYATLVVVALFFFVWRKQFGSVFSCRLGHWLLLLCKGQPASVICPCLGKIELQVLCKMTRKLLKGKTSPLSKSRNHITITYDTHKHFKREGKSWNIHLIKKSLCFKICNKNGGSVHFPIRILVFHCSANSKTQKQFNQCMPNFFVNVSKKETQVE